jgi:uncharacterized protein
VSESRLTFSNQTALITGASVGIGHELAKLFAADGFNLVLVARDAERMNAMVEDLKSRGSGRVLVLPKDLSLPESCEQIASQLAANKIDIDILVNNAGFGDHGLFWQTDEKRQLDMLHVNITALTHLTRLFLPGMIQRKRGRIMNVASVAGYVPGPLMAVYFATKAYVISFSIAVNEECRGFGVTVTAVCPGATRTEFHTRANIADTGLFEGHLMSAEAVARIGYRGTMRGKPLVVTGWMNRLTTLAVPLFPRTLVARITAARNRRR